VWLEGLGRLKKIHLIETRTRDLPACSIVPQPTDIIVVPCFMNSTNSTPVLFQKTVAISFMADIGLFGEYVCIHCFDCSLVSAFTNETQVLLPLTCMM
jgi:hypothetical protein